MDGWIETIFGSGQGLSPGQECARAVLVFFYGFLLVRLAGRRIFARWSALDTVVAIIAGSNLSRAITGPVPLFGTMAATAVLVILHWLLAKLAIHSSFASSLLEGRAVKLGSAGTLHEDKMKQWSVSETDIAEAMRQSGVWKLDEIGSVTLEPSGTINVSKPQ
jgi:uncharacterized membrane protein YcaP (DUF421 family)